MFANNDLSGSIVCLSAALSIYFLGAFFSADALLKQARDCRREGEYEKASKLYYQYLEKMPRNADALAEHSYCLNYLYLYPEALSAADRAVDIDSHKVFALSNKAWALNHLGRYPEALESAEQGISFNRADGESWCAKGEALLNLGRYSEAVPALNEHYKIHPTESYGLELRAEAYEKLGKKDLADKDQEIAEKLSE